MRWQDENPIEELVQEGAGIKESYLTVARVSEHRKEAQIGSQAIANAYAARDWLDHAAEAATRETGEAASASASGVPTARPSGASRPACGRSRRRRLAK